LTLGSFAEQDADVALGGIAEFHQNRICIFFARNAELVADFQNVGVLDQGVGCIFDVFVVGLAHDGPVGFDVAEEFVGEGRKCVACGNRVGFSAADCRIRRRMGSGRDEREQKCRDDQNINELGLHLS